MAGQRGVRPDGELRRRARDRSRPTTRPRRDHLCRRMARSGSIARASPTATLYLERPGRVPPPARPRWCSASGTPRPGGTGCSPGRSSAPGSTTGRSTRRGRGLGEECGLVRLARGDRAGALGRSFARNEINFSGKSRRSESRRAGRAHKAYAVTPREPGHDPSPDPREPRPAGRGGLGRGGRGRRGPRRRLRARPRCPRGRASGTAGRAGSPTRPTRCSPGWSSTGSGRPTSASGLVETPSDLGFNGGDALASRAARLARVGGPGRRGWSLKAIHRLIVTSATYRQSSRPDPAALGEWTRATASSGGRPRRGWRPRWSATRC